MLAIMNDFIQRWCDDPAAFERPIKRQRINTFAEEGKITKRTTKGVIEEIKMERDLMGKLLLKSLKEKLGIGIVLSYPLTPVPLVFCHLDGSKNVTNKAVLYCIKIWKNELKVILREQSKQTSLTDLFSSTYCPVTFLRRMKPLPGSYL
jgi:hypothetical protein